MKKHLLGWVAMAGMLFVTSCAKDVDVVAADTSEATVTFNVGLESALSTRAISDGSKVKTLYVAAFNEGKQVDETQSYTITPGTNTNVTLTLGKGAEYQVAFWAQSEEAADYYDVEEFPTVKISYDEAKNNDENRDAFFAVQTVTVSDNIETQKITLKRPFAQINLGVLEAVETVKSSAMTVKGGLATSFNVLTGSATGESETVTVTFADADILEENLTTKGTNYTWLSMSYVLVAGDKETLNLKFTFNKSEENSITVDNVPVQPNTRTNLLANNNTTDVDFEVEVGGSFGEDDDINQLPWDDDEEAAVITVSKFTVTTTETEVSFEAEYTYEGEGLVEAQFVCTPNAAGAALTRAEGGVVTVKGEVSDGKITATAPIGSFTLGVKYNVTLKVLVDGATAKVETSGEAETQTPELTIPDQQGGDEPGDDEEETINGFESQEIFIPTSNETTTYYYYNINGNTMNNKKATGVKLGKSKYQGMFTSAEVGVTGDKVLSLYGIAWSGNDATTLYIRVNNGGEVDGASSVVLKGNATATGTATAFTVSDDDYYTFKLKNLTKESTITLSTSEEFSPANKEGRAILARINLTNTDPGVEPNDTEPEPEEPGDSEVYTFKKVTSDNDMTDGDYLIVYEDGNVAFDGSRNDTDSKLDASSNTIAVTISESTIKLSDKYTFTYNKSEGTLKSASGFYIGQTTDANGLKANATTSYTNTVTIAEDGATANILSSGGAYLRYNAAGGQERFRYFQSSTYTAQKAIQLYKKVVE